ncbi:MAG: T9SS type A sorting domain-containing protein [Bacteroidetes bacterium]|nr:T9SS type A sorting domain-containing protein [Bacteroidota bacterium]
MKKTHVITILFAIVVSYLDAQATIDTCRMKLGMNLTALSFTDVQQPFADLMKTCDVWSTQDTAGFPIGTNTNELSSIPLDANGYPLQLPVNVGGLPRTLFTKMVSGINGYYPAGNYVVLYDGTGTFRFAGSSIYVVNNNNAGRIEINVTPNSTGIYLKIVTSLVTDPVHNVRVLMPGTEFTYSTQPFNTVFTGKIAPFTTLRFMDWNNNNTNTEVQWQNRRLPGFYTQGSTGGLDTLGVAWEYAIQLCNSEGKDCWMNIPTKADNNYITQLATLFRDNLDPGLKIYLEYSNECWNQILSVNNYNYIQTNGTGANHSQKTASFLQNIFSIWSSVFGSAMSTRVVRVAAGRLTQNTTEVSDIMNYLLANGSGADAISVDAYFKWIQTDYTNLINNYCPNATVPDIISITQSRMVSYYPMLVSATQTSLSYGIPLIFYEGGQDVHAGGAPCATTPIYAVQNDPAMFTFYQTWFQKLRDTTNATLFMHFALAGVGTMGALSNIYETTSLKYQALTDYIDSCQAVPLGFNENIPAENSLSIFPDPSTGNFSIEMGMLCGGEALVEIYDLQGQVVYSETKNIPAGQKIISINDPALQEGIYFIRITENEKIFKTKFVVEK